MAGDAPLLRIEGLVTHFEVRSGPLRRVTDVVRAVDGVDLEVPRGKTLALVGESGCGKTTVGRTLLGLEQARSGRIWFDGVELSTLDSEARRSMRRRIQMVFQDPAAALDPRLRISDAVAEGMQAFGIGRNRRERSDRVADLLEQVKLDRALMERYPHELSGGQRQRVCIARALAVDPELVVCDESVSALDVSIQAQILNLLAELQEQRGLSYLFITHDLQVVRHVADRVAVMYLGQIVEEGSVERIFETPAHPYTQGLLAAAPSLDLEVRGRPVLLGGDVPSPLRPPRGCRFHTRCPVALARCADEMPDARALEDGMGRCFLLDDLSFDRRP
jgi:peptide/nickel transport system ATP-binding protein